MIWADRTVAALWFCYAVFILFMYAHGDMTGFGGALLAIGWGTLYLALPLWIVLRALNYALWGRPALRIHR